MNAESEIVDGQATDRTGLVRVVRPTLIAAIGGTGTAAAKVARARIESLLGPNHHYVAFRAFDTSFQDNSEPMLVDNSEYIYLGGFNAQARIADIVSGKAYPHWKEWLPHRLNFQQVAFGAGGIRPIGRLCYFYRRDRIQHSVQEALTTITNADLALQHHQQTGVRVNLEAGIDIHVLCSVCGGTGSGMFLDLAFDLRRWAEALTGREVTVTGHLVLPEAFRSKPVVLKALEANTYAALQELDRFMNATAEDPWRVEYEQGRVEESRRAPFDNCYLLSGLQQGGTSDVDALTSIIGEAVSILTLSQVGQAVSEGVINMAGQKKSSRDEYGRACCYSSYGLLGLEIPAALLADSLGPHLARQARDRLSLDAPVSEQEAQKDRDAFGESMRLRVDRIRENLPKPVAKTRSVRAMIEDFGKKHEAPRRELQEQLSQARETFERELRSAASKPLWLAAELRVLFQSRLEATLLQPGGLDRHLKYLVGAVEALQDFQQQLRSAASDAKVAADRSREVADRIENRSLAERQWPEIWEAVRQWEGHLEQRGLAEIATEQALLVEQLADLVQRDQVDLWKRIRRLFETVHLKAGRDEDAHYRGSRSRTSVCPLRYFLDRLEPNRENLLRKLLAELIEDVGLWASLSSSQLSDRFYRLCTRAIQEHFADESGMDCDSLLADCYRYPSETYQTEVSVLLSRARANWEIHGSYSMRTNLLEISAIGVEVESTLYETLQRSSRQIAAVEEQRADFVPIFRTEHGASLIGLKRMEAYRDSLVDSVTQEQRFDFHFFNDRRWITKMELPGEDPVELERLYVFTASVLIKTITRIVGQGYRLEKAADLLGSGVSLESDGSFVLGRFRREAYERIGRDPHLLAALRADLAVQERQAGWLSQLERHIFELEKHLDDEVTRSRGELQRRSEGVMSLDVFQVHSEIRALRAHMRIEDLGL